MFAGAVRETVLSDPEVIRRVNADFVAVALKATLVHDPPDDEEGRIYREIARSRIAPQGICVANSAGKVLEWVLMFDDQKSILAFLDHGLKRFRDHPDAKRPVAAERYRMFPGTRLDDVQDSGQDLPIVEGHPNGRACPAQPPLPSGTILARVYGRALGTDGHPLADTRSQRHYVEDRFHVPVVLQGTLARVLDEEGDLRRRRIPDECARLFVTHAYLGELDVQPLENPRRGKSSLRQCEFWAEREAGGSSAALWRVEGSSEVYTDEMANAGPGDFHEVQLTWEGFLEVDGRRIRLLCLTARGMEKPRFGSARGPSPIPAASLPGGRAIDQACEVRYGIIGEPVAAETKSF